MIRFRDEGRHGGVDRDQLTESPKYRTAIMVSLRSEPPLNGLPIGYPSSQKVVELTDMLGHVRVTQVAYQSKN